MASETEVRQARAHPYRRMKALARLCALPLLAGLAIAPASAEVTPAGLWKTVDDGSGKAKSLVRIVDHGGSLEGRIEKLLDPDDPPAPVCEKCSDERRNQPVLGLLIIRNVKKSATSAGRWEGGDILDPENGKVYRVRLEPSPDGRQLEVRGYIGTPLLGRSQTWQRVE